MEKIEKIEKIEKMEKKVILESEDEKSSFWIVKNFTDDYYPILSKLELNIKPEIFVYGRKCHQQRDVGFYSDESQGYTYSKTISRSFPLTCELKELLNKVNQRLETKFNGILINRYNTGAEYLSAHSDSDSGLDRNSMVAGLSYGATRTFRIRQKKTKEKIMDIELEPCTLYVMDGNFQKEYTHEIPIQKNIKDSRISLTFRTHLY